jgi:hypothetical protein
MTVAERPREASLSDREERIRALDELDAMGILHLDEFVAEMKCVTDPQQRLDPTSPELFRVIVSAGDVIPGF